MLAFIDCENVREDILHSVHGVPLLNFLDRRDPIRFNLSPISPSCRLTTMQIQPSEEPASEASFNTGEGYRLPSLSFNAQIIAKNNVGKVVQGF